MESEAQFSGAGAHRHGADARARDTIAVRVRACQRGPMSPFSQIHFFRLLCTEERPGAAPPWRNKATASAHHSTHAELWHVVEWRIYRESMCANTPLWHSSSGRHRFQV